ncbi:hypothetical protein TG4357_03134 [Thalassovita gelatinovora]|uniref:Surface lipoprotein assembly modifier C-terminal domain-containing protein n=1 Tax=Thalassovita gelatinovora TaxID=53501 RepID=A0A0P1G6F3_THAGE|nr:surface lipoprotein assembly modifier [Thalassovita gelatinovora]QIZ82103.1 DUF560 domain-containing protein [Thalassovita gelatinovora]CUH67660.1 hypothetical protein TG4357_03134 [Thalassovita gelatinovora]SEP69902.1 Protein of unknown function [Thalassovita gelatinovora]
MMTRSATIFKAGVRVFLLALSLLAAAPGWADPQDTVRLSIPKARDIALGALQSGQPNLALQLASGLLRRDPHDAQAHFIIARALMQLKQPRDGRRAAALAYRHARTRQEKFQASQLAAKLSLDGKQNGLAQLWLRRSLLHLPAEDLRPRVIEDYKILRQITPWTVSAQFSLAPSNNLNNGTDSPYNFIDGLPVVGVLSDDAQALSGLRCTAYLRYSRRLSGSKRHETRLIASYYAQRVRLSQDARALAPAAENGDYAYDHLELGLEHRTKAGTGLVTLDGGVGRSWYGGAPYQWVMQAGIAKDFKLTEGSGLRLSARLLRRLPDRASLRPVDEVDLRAEYGTTLVSGDRINLGLTLSDAQSATRNSRQQQATGYIGYRFAKPLGPVTVSASLGASLRRYPDYALGLLVVPGGREDEMLFGAVDFSFRKLDYAGFVPTLKVQARKTRSNVSRFETNEMSVSFGIKSSF